MRPLLCSIFTKGVPSLAFWYRVSSYRICRADRGGRGGERGMWVALGGRGGPAWRCIVANSRLGLPIALLTGPQAPAAAAPTTPLM
jgi:hypothetical protein